MKNWQKEYKQRLVNGGLDFIKQEVNTRLHYIKQADKRTYNGKYTVICETAWLMCCYDVIVGLGLEQQFSGKVHEKEIASAKERLAYWAQEIGIDFMENKLEREAI